MCFFNLNTNNRRNDDQQSALLVKAAEQEWQKIPTAQAVFMLMNTGEKPVISKHGNYHNSLGGRWKS